MKIKVTIEQTETGFSAFYRIPKTLTKDNIKSTVIGFGKTLPKLFKNLQRGTKIALK